MAHGHSHGAGGGGHSHGGERSQSLQNLKMKDNELSTTPKLRKPIKSTPALNTDSPLGTPNSASTSSSATGSFGKASTITTEVDVVVSAASRQTHSDDSDDDDHHERKTNDLNSKTSLFYYSTKKRKRGLLNTKY